MRSADLKALPDGAYVRARFDGSPEPETVRLLTVAPPDEREVRRGAVSNRVHVRRFLTGGTIDTWVYPRDVIDARQPDAGTLAVIEYLEREVGPKPARPAPRARA
jgi:hypothetical protein